MENCELLPRLNRTVSGYIQWVRVTQRRWKIFETKRKKLNSKVNIPDVKLHYLKTCRKPACPEEKIEGLSVSYMSTPRCMQQKVYEKHIFTCSYLMQKLLEPNKVNLLSREKGQNECKQGISLKTIKTILVPVEIAWHLFYINIIWFAKCTHARKQSRTHTRKHSRWIFMHPCYSATDQHISGGWFHVGVPIRRP